MRRLVVAGLIVSQKGHGGGFKFARPLNEIFFSDILNAINSPEEAEKYTLKMYQKMQIC